MANRPTSSAPPASLSPKVAFVVHLTGNATDGGLTGRVEHVTTGCSLRFQTVAQLVEFMQRTVARQDGQTLEFL